MFDNLQPFQIKTKSDQNVIINGLSSTKDSSKPALLLIHGFPQTLHIWHRVVPQVVDKYNVVLIDIRGYGQSSKPADVASYAKSAMARDCIDVMDALGYTDSFFVCAHDRGARVAHKLAVDYPDRIRKFILLDICPTLAMYSKTDMDFAKAYFHWFFLIQASPMPEMLITAKPRELAEMFMGGRQGDGISIFEPECFETYAKSLADYDTVHAMCNDYRASATLDLDEAKEDLKAGRKIKSPLLVLWGKHGVIEKGFDAVQEWRDVADEGVEVRGRSVESGHYIPEQAPDEVLTAIKEFLV
ncbi:uncharacterized protein FIESC28_00784 [Fusarium coffeatum]|uniref:AB hydrolase-1 domain-containing protein n=1 Tax=Fusarium coffeatum TaxID=231269 RepID=A0A366SAQ7_9HYPO|nr:uncharacterized protein FIESC28_00784 [Fusarium coffeatum]RBR26379.1 hypothetical protein FIESC28_00784 [Fusarium coffeatum]